MPCSICGKTGHNKKTCPHKPIVLKRRTPPVPAQNKPSSIEIEIGLIALVFDLPLEVKKYIQKKVFWADWKSSPTIQFAGSIGFWTETRFRPEFADENVMGGEISFKQFRNERCARLNSWVKYQHDSHPYSRNYTGPEFPKGKNKYKTESKQYWATISSLNEHHLTSSPKIYFTDINKQKEILQRVRDEAREQGPHYLVKVMTDKIKLLDEQGNNTRPYKRLTNNSWVKK